MAYPPLTGLFAERYLIDRELGHGATAVVYLAQDKKHDREIALKVLSKDLAHALGPQRFLREIQVTSRLHHPHILPIFDSGEWNGLLYYVLPFVRGESLRQKIERENQLPIEECVRVTCEVADALSHAHLHGIVHRDVKPENIMLSEGHALLADFGIARSLDVHTGERLTSSGLIVGTSAYMSPEQAAGEEKIDARSDIYSLACVLYEMIAGVQAFTGPTTQSVIAQRFKHTPRPVSTYRPQVPEYLERALEKALAISPADRYSKIKDFAAELLEVAKAGRDRRRSPLRRVIHGKQKAFGFSAVAIAALMAAFVAVNPPGHWRSPFARHAVLDSTKYVVIPFGREGSMKRADVDAAAALHRSLSKWTGLSLVDPAVVSDAVTARSVVSVRDALDLARTFGAGRMIRVDSALDATLYDVSSGSAVSDVSSEYLKSDTARYAKAASSLLGIPNLPKAANGGDGLTNSLPAWRAYGLAHVALANWKIEEARAEFRAAVNADPAFAAAQAWSATVSEWSLPRSDSSAWQDDAIRAAGGSSNLSPRDREIARGIGALARGDYPEACTSYKALIAVDSLDFAGWYGLGECQALDRMVVRSASSPSGWKFRSNSAGALDAYQRAFRIEPRSYAFARLSKLQRLFPISANQMRPGTGPPPEGGVYPAAPSIDHDTVALFPYPVARLSSLPPSAVASRGAATAANLDVLLNFASNWARSAPSSANAYEAIAALLEAKGDVGEARSEEMSASQAVAKALRLATDPLQRARLVATEIRLRLKRGEFSAARALADSLLATTVPPDTDIAPELAGPAALTGRLALTARYVGPYISDQIPSQVREIAVVLFAHALLGDCGPRLTELREELDRRLLSYVSEKDRTRIRMLASSRALSLMSPCTSGESALSVSTPPDRLVRMQQAVARRDRAAVRSIFDTLAIMRRTALPGDLSMDYTYQEAWVRTAIGDTAGAIRQLDLALGALPTLSAASLKEPGGAGALVRAMMLRAELANKAGERSIASRYATAAATLWAGADKELQPLVAKMRAIAASPGTR